MDNHPVAMLTTVHDNSANSNESRQQRMVWRRYVNLLWSNATASSWEGYTQEISYYLTTGLWWRRAFFHLIEVAIVNAYIMYMTTLCEGCRLTHKELRIRMAKELLTNTVEIESHCCGPHSNPNSPPFRLTGQYFPAILGLTPLGRPSQPDCVVCSRKERQRTWVYHL